MEEGRLTRNPPSRRDKREGGGSYKSLRGDRGIRGKGVVFRGSYEEIEGRQVVRQVRWKGERLGI